jgi:L-malate glycosyltransferase
MNDLSEKVKVLIIAPGPPLVGGQAVQSKRIAGNFQNEPFLQVDIQQNNPRFGGKLQEVRYIRTVLTVVKYIFDIFRRIPQYDIIHVFSASYMSFVMFTLPALLVAKLFSKKTILNYRSGEAEDFFSRWGKPFLRFVKMFDAVIAPSNYLVDVFKKFDVRASSINNFIHGEKYIYRNRVPLRPVFLSNRILEPLYNIDCILKAFRIIQQKYSRAKLIVAHEGFDRERLEGVAKALELKNVEFTGLIPHDKIAELYDSVDIYLNSPDLDCMPGSLIECFASGLPIVSTNAGGIPYIVIDEVTGFLVELNDHQTMAEKAIFLLENDDFAEQMIANGVAESKKYLWMDVREKWLQLYSDLSNQSLIAEPAIKQIQSNT